jgi:hypothetical protein
MASRMPPWLTLLTGAAMVAIVTVSCGDRPPAAPTTVRSLGAVGAPAEYWVTLSDETPEPATPAPSGSAPSPWPPGPPPNAAPGVPIPTPPSTHFRVSMKVDPEPVAHSGVPVPLAGCQANKYTWYYDQHLISETGVVVTFTERENFFDGRFVSKTIEPIRLGGNGSSDKVAVLHTRWCSGVAIAHYTQTRFKGTDAEGEPIVISGPWVRLLAP